MLGNGWTVSVLNDDEVTLTDTKGNEQATSSCGAQGLSFAKSVAFWAGLESAVFSRNAHAASDLVNFPLSWTHGATTGAVRSSARFEQVFPRMFTTAIRHRLAQIDPHDVFCHDGGVMIDSGNFWANANARGHYGLTSVDSSPAGPVVP